MAVLSDPEREALWAKLMREISARRDTMPVTKADLRAAINAADAWVDSNAASYKAAIPQPARSALTNKQLAELLASVILRRFQVA